MHAKPQKQHEWLNQLVGEWTVEGECSAGPDQPPSKSTGRETVRSVGGVWVVAEGQMSMPDGSPGTTLMTLGYDPRRERYVGTWVGSMMANLWVYDGRLDDAGRVLTLETEGPNFADEGKTLGKFRDVIEVKAPDHRVLTSHMLGPDGQWHQFMTAHYRRKR